MINLTNQQINTIKRLIQGQIELDFPRVAFKKVQVEKDGRIIVEFEHGIMPIEDYSKQLYFASSFIKPFINKALKIEMDELNDFFKTKSTFKFNQIKFARTLKSANFENQDAIDLAISANMFMKSKLNVVNNTNTDANLIDKFTQTINEYMQAQYGVTLQDYNTNEDIRIQVLPNK
jgi:hypothetical protein